MTAHATALRALCLALLAASQAGCLALNFVPTLAGAPTTPSPDRQIVRFPSSDGVEIEGRLFVPEIDKQSQSLPNPRRAPASLDRAVVLFCHGVNDNNESLQDAAFTRAGLRVFKFDYRGFGNSTPAPLTDRGLADDAWAALEHLRARPDVDPERVLVVGHSLGGAYALAVAARAERTGAPVRGVIVMSSFAQWRTVANRLLPVIGALIGGVNGPNPRDHFRSLASTHSLITHAGDDTLLLPSDSIALYAAALAAGSPASLYIHPSGGHAGHGVSDDGLARTLQDFALTTLADRGPDLWRFGRSPPGHGSPTPRSPIDTPASSQAIQVFDGPATPPSP